MPAGSDGDDLLSGSTGGQTLDGGAGDDTATYAQATTGVIADLAGGFVAYAPRIMPLGDSITFGVQSETLGGYRGPLWDLTVANDMAVNFVGSVVGGSIEDPDNEGHPGWTIDQMDANIATWISAARPDVVLLIAGTNNTKGNPLPTAPQILAKLSRLIDDIAAQPNAPTLFVGPIPPMTADQPASRIALAQAYDALIPDLIAQKRAAGVDVTYVDMSDLTPADITAPPHDPGLHPNPSGYQKIAADWYEALTTRLAGANGGLSHTAPDQLVSIENLEGSTYRDILIGDGGANTLIGLGGGDLLNGGGGADTMVGGLGDDIYYVDDAGDQVVELVGQGRDTVRTIFTSVTLAANLENLTFVGSGDFTGSGNELLNVITGGSGADSLSGGQDTLSDTLAGGAGDDLYVVMAGDVVIEAPGAGRDRVETDLPTYILRPNVEELVHTGPAAFKGFGNADNNLIVGGVGDDALNGLSGADTLRGGAGSDSYTVDDAGDVVSEIDPVTGGDAGGVDTVKTTLASYTLGPFIEKLTFTGLDPAVGFLGTGNELVNKITGGPGADTLSGGLDKLKDTLGGGAGDDVYIVQFGDVVIENADAGRDQIRTALPSYALPANVEDLIFTGVGPFYGGGNDADNLMVGGAAADVFVGGLGADTIAGGGGVDTIQGSRVELNGDVISDYAGDKIVLSQSLTSTANVQLDTTGPYTLIKIDGDNNGDFETVITLQGALPGQLLVESASGLSNNVISLSTPSLSLAGANAIRAEGNSGSTAFTFTVTRSGDLSGVATADWTVSGSGTAPADAADFGGALPSGQVSFAAGESSELITLNVVGDTAFEPDEGFTVTLSNASSGIVISQASAAGSILNDDPVNLIGTSGDDLLYGGAGADVIQGMAGADKIFGNAGDDVLDGGDGADIISAGDQNDFVRGGAGDDVLKGNNDNDTLVGGAGADTLTGSSGLDVFRFESLDGSIDVITDFSGNDRIELDLAGLGVTGGQVLFVNGLAATAPGVAALHYSLSTGALYLDLNGGDAADAAQFATVSNNYALSQGSFLLS